MRDLGLALGGFLIMGMLCMLLERLWPEDPRQPAWRRDSMTDVVYFAIRILLSVLLVIATAVTGSALPQQPSGLFASQPFWLQVVVFLLVSDLVSYWIHRMEHHVSILWPIHAVHHGAESIDWLVATRVHPLELVLQKMASSVPLYFLGFSPEVFALVVPIVATYSLLLHANVNWSYGPLRHLVASPAFHRWHHSSEAEALDKNFAQLFPAFDYLFGTAYFPRNRHSRRYGLLREQMPDGVWRQFMYPFSCLGHGNKNPHASLAPRSGEPGPPLVTKDSPVQAGIDHR